jgi:hypothetical protein
LRNGGSGPNDKLTLTGTNAVLAGAGATVRIRVDSTLTAGPYVLIELTGNAAHVVSDFESIPAWIGTPHSDFRIVTDSRRVLLARQPSGAVLFVR